MRTRYSVAAIAAALLVATAGTAIAQCGSGYYTSYSDPSWSGYSNTNYDSRSYGNNEGQSGYSHHQSSNMQGNWTPQANYHYAGGQQANWNSNARSSARVHTGANATYNSSNQYTNSGYNQASNYGHHNIAQNQWNQAGDYSNSWNGNANAQFQGSAGGYSGSNAGGFGIGW